MPDSNKLLVALRQINRAIDLHSKKLSKETGLTSPQILILKSLDGDGRAKPSVIAKSVHLSPATVTSIVDRLEKSGLVRREQGQADKRVVDVVLTQSGREKVKSLPDLLQEGFLKSFSAIEDWEQTLLVSSVQRIAAMMNADELDSAPILAVGELDP